MMWWSSPEPKAPPARWFHQAVPIPLVVPDVLPDSVGTRWCHRVAEADHVRFHPLLVGRRRVARVIPRAVEAKDDAIHLSSSQKENKPASQSDKSPWPLRHRGGSELSSRARPGGRSLPVRERGFQVRTPVDYIISRFGPGYALSLRDPDRVSLQLDPDSTCPEASSMLLRVITPILLLLPAMVRADDRPAAEKPFGLDRRIPWNDSRVVGSPDPLPPYKVVRAFPKLTIKQPLSMTPEPGTNRLFILQPHELLGRAGPRARRQGRPGRERGRGRCSRSMAWPSAWRSTPTTSATVISISA